jgi:hypothetical protein
LLAFWVPCLALKLVILLVTCFLCKKIWQDHDNQHKHEERPKGRERERERDVKICYRVTYQNRCCHQASNDMEPWMCWWHWTCFFCCVYLLTYFSIVR